MYKLKLHHDRKKVSAPVLNEMKCKKTQTETASESCFFFRIIFSSESLFYILSVSEKDEEKHMKREIDKTLTQQRQRTSEMPFASKSRFRDSFFFD